MAWPAPASWRPQRGPVGPLSFGFRDLLLLRTTKGLLESGVPMRRIRRIWASLREQLAADLPLTSITIHTDGEEVVASDGGARWQPDSGPVPPQLRGQRDRGARGAPTALGSVGRERIRTRVIRGDRAGGSASRPRRPRLRRGVVRSGCELETSSPEQAREAYQRALEIDPGVTDAHVNLGRQFHMAGELGRAEPHYREAVRLDPDDPTPHFNLGVLLEEVGRRDEAVHAYRQAILRDPDFADAHCNLGLLLESLGRRQEAVRHLMAARQLNGSPE